MIERDSFGTSYTLISPVHWVTQPAIALQAIHRYGATVYYHPNFAFNFMTKRVKDAELDGIDLSGLRICCNGAEPCFFESHDGFARRFARWGFRREALAIVYGMAEVTNSVVIVDDARAELPERRVGEVAIRALARLPQQPRGRRALPRCGPLVLLGRLAAAGRN